MNSTASSQKNQTSLAVLIADLLIASGTLVFTYESVRNIDNFAAALPVAFGAFIYLALVVRRAAVTRMLPAAGAVKVATIGMIAADNAWASGEGFIGRDQIRRAAVKRYEESKAAAGEQRPIFRHVWLKLVVLFAMVVVLLAALQ